MRHSHVLRSSRARLVPLSALALLVACQGSLGSTAFVGQAGDGGSSPTDAARPEDAGGVERDATMLPRVDGGVVIPEGDPVFVVTGKFARITTSCDDGLTFPFNRSDDDGASCNGIDCDHHPGSATGLTFGGGDVYASFGWGSYPTRVMRSSDGTHWETVFTMSGFAFAGLVWAGDRLIGAEATPRYSTDRGMTFRMAAWPDYRIAEGMWPNARRVGFADFDGGRIALISGNGDGSWGDTTVSRDQGLTYQHPTTLPEGCRGHSREMAYGGGVWIQAWGNTGVVCRSTDGGDHWELTTVVTTDAGSVAAPIWTGSEFVMFAGMRAYRSPDGAAWTSSDIDARITIADYNPVTGTYLGTGGGSYETQRLYRSTDGGQHWEALSESAFRRSHPIAFIRFGYVSGACD